MKTCNGCKYADWQKTAAGRLHPSGDGKCAYEYKAPRLPLAFYYIGGAPVPCGGHISRRREFKEHCPYWSPANDKLSGGEAVRSDDLLAAAFDLVSAARRVRSKFGTDDHGKPLDWTEWRDVDDACNAIDRIAANPTVDPRPTCKGENQ